MNLRTLAGIGHSKPSSAAIRTMTSNPKPPSPAIKLRKYSLIRRHAGVIGRPLDDRAQPLQVSRTARMRNNTCVRHWQNGQTMALRADMGSTFLRVYKCGVFSHGVLGLWRNMGVGVGAIDKAA
jgi:hypothetical protein